MADPGTYADAALAWTRTVGMAATEYNSWRAQVVSALQAGILDPGGQYATQTGKCNGATKPPSNALSLAATSLGVAGTGASIGVSIAGIAAAATPIIGASVAAGTLLITLVSKLFGPATSALEGKYLCPLVAAANHVLVQIMSELQLGQLTVSQAAAASLSLYQSFHSQLLIPEPLGSQKNALLYYNTPNDSQFFDSALNAMNTYNVQVRYPQLALQGSALLAQQQASASAALNAQVAADVAAALAAAEVKVIAATKVPVAPVSKAPVAPVSKVITVVPSSTVLSGGVSAIPVTLTPTLTMPVSIIALIIGAAALLVFFL
jgi:hypothetical protein